MKNYSKKSSLIFVIALSVIAFSCDKPDVSKRSVEMIVAKESGDSIFKNLLKVVDNVVVDDKLNDSLAFLILPVQASCPSCRKKTIDSIIKHKDNIKDRHFIIINANGGRQFIEGYFKEQNSKLPTIENKLFLDSSNLSYRLNLCQDKPTIYYTYNRNAYKRVRAIPVTVRDDLREFFSGSRN
ncbi:hypothetical protein [Chitinophaga filiformis]|uniref:AhpC/TSA family protein n=1 Tax=Chitinophaga filiformis TaxID=104663 RepID=A0A1G7UNP7_CHIFI|nr:hypothetical protein [Chitinophaga filiformis]SDG48851.1 hypothetical protein SAMN04488121_104441 [Chitinophaga filiformis]